MSKDEVIQKIREIVLNDKSLIGTEIEISFMDKKTNKLTRKTIKIEEIK